MPAIAFHNALVLVDDSLTVGRVGHDIFHDTWEHALDVCRDHHGLSEINDSAALAIASAFQSPSGAGAIFAQLSTTGTVGVGELLDAIAAEYRDPTYDADVRLALDMLATWALHHPSRTQGTR
jgi:hypothetical protein